MTVINKIDKLLELYNLSIDELIEIASKVTAENFNNEVELCSIISAKTGTCSQNCRYCAQSSHYRVNIETHPLVKIDEIKKAAFCARKSRATRFSIVTSGKTPTQNELDSICEMLQELAGYEGIHWCASIGILNEKQVKQLKDAGLERYHHNINTCKSYHNDICTTHSYEDRINTVKLCQKYGIEVCSGGIIGMGETRRQRAELALELAALNPVSIPVNFLTPIEGTPFENYHDKIDEDEILRTLAIFRIANPKAVIRYAGGRATRFSVKYQELGLKAGVNGILIGNYLTTIGITPEEDQDMIKRNGMCIKYD